MTARQFFLRALLALVLLLVLLASFNWLVNPIRLFTAPDIPGFTAYKTSFFFDTFVSKPYIVSRDRPDAVILGTSRAGASLRTDHPGWSGYRVYNFALPGTTALIQWRNFQHASAGGKLRLAVVPLDFLMFNSCNDQGLQPHFRTYLERLRGGDSTNWEYAQRALADYLTQLTAWSTTQASWNTIRSQQKFGDDKPGAMYLRPDGFWQSFHAGGARQRKAFQAVERRYMRSGWFPAPLHCFELKVDGRISQLDHLQRLLEQAYRQNTRLILYFSPFHARFAEAMHSAGLWPQFERLKRQLVQMNTELAAQYQAELFSLWDFSGYNSITTAAVPALNDTATKMQYFFDSTHSTPLTGRLVQDVLFAVQSGAAPAPADFGRRLQADNIERILAKDRAARLSWVSTHPQDVQEITELQGPSLRASGR